MSESTTSISTALLSDFLTASDKRTYQQLVTQLPPGFRRIDAYLSLRERDPQRLSALSYLDIFSLVKRAVEDRLGGVLSLLLEDIVGSDMATSKSKSSYFRISAGTEERYRLLRAILVRSNHVDPLLHDEIALDVFMLMLDDLLQSRQTAANNVAQKTQEDVSASVTASSLAQGATIAIPDDFPLGETRRLVRLIVHLGNPELAPILKVLRAHLEANTPDFPTARQGVPLMTYYLQPSLRDFGAALDVVRALRDTNAIAQQVVDDSIQDGKKYLAQFQKSISSGSDVAQAPLSDEELQQICLDVSLRLMIMKILMDFRPRGGLGYRKAFENLCASLRLDLVDASDLQASDDIKPLLDVPMRSIRSAFLHLVGQNDRSCLAQALFVLQRSDPRFVAMLPSADLQAFCDAARSVYAIDLAAETYALVVKAKTSPSCTSGLPSEHKHVLARDATLVDADTFLALLREILANGRKIVVIALLRALRLLPLTDYSVVQLNLRFSQGYRSQLVAILAKVGLTEEAFELFQHWTHWRYEANSDPSVPLSGRTSLRMMGWAEVADPLIERQVRLMHDPASHVATSADCLLSLVKGLCRRSLSTAPDGQSGNEASPVWTVAPSQLDKARFVIDVFRHACTPLDWTHYQLTALAQACFIAQDVSGAFDALAKISFLREIPDKVDIAVLLGGLVDLDADKAVGLFIQHCTAPQTISSARDTRKSARSKKGAAPLGKVPLLAPMDPTPRLTSTLITRALAKNRTDLADKLIDFSQAKGIASRLGYTASLRGIFLPDVVPGKILHTIQRILKQGWQADPTVLEKLARRLLKASLRDAAARGNEAVSVTGEKGLPPKERLHCVQAAVALSKISAGTKDVANLRTISRALHAIIDAGSLFNKKIPASTTTTSTTTEAVVSPVRAARQQGQEQRRLQWIACLDSTVHMLRWTKFFDTGDDYQQNMPLWKLSQAGDGQLISADLGEMMDRGFNGPHEEPRTRVTMSAATTVSPISAAELADKSTLGAEDGVEGTSVAPADGAVQSPNQRRANVLPAHLFRRIIEAYLALGDVSGAAEVASWMRDEAKVDLDRNGQETTEFVDRIKAAVLKREAKQTSSEHSMVKQEAIDSSNILRMLAGQQRTAHTKSWWLP